MKITNTAGYAIVKTINEDTMLSAHRRGKLRVKTTLWLKVVSTSKLATTTYWDTAL